MMKGMIFLRKLLHIFLTVFIFSLFMQPSAAIEEDIINDYWSKSTYVYGDNLTESQIIETAKLLNIKDLESVYKKSVSYDDLLRYIGGDPNKKANMVSSVLVTKERDGHGIVVHITTPENITQITSLNYENAAITAGVHSATIEVASIRPVTGESALTGIYKAYEANGENLDPERMETAQEELIVVNEITQENKEDKNFTPEKLNNVIIQIKNELSDIYINSNNTENSISREEIENIVRQTIEDYNLDEVISQDQIQRLISYFEKYVNTDALTSQEVRDQLKDLSVKLADDAKEIYRKANEAGILDKIADFFQKLFEELKVIFVKE